MRVLLAPDCFAGTLTARQAAEALAAGWRSVRPDDDLVLQPLSDGGPGFLDALPGTRVTALVQDPLGRPTLATFVLDGTTGYVEAAAAAGMALLDPPERDPSAATSFGVGQLVRTAVEAGATRVVVGLGGTATNDGGAGLLAALDLLHPVLQPLAPADLCGPPTLCEPLDPAKIILGGAGALAGVELVVASDVDNPLLGEHGATRVFARQKGATPEQVEDLEERMARWAGAVEAAASGSWVTPQPGDRTGDLPREVPLRDLPGAGAAGGLGFALLALGATRVAGLDVVAHAVGLDALVASADLVVTGEGRLDGSSTRGKVVAGVAARALEHGVPCVAVAGEVLLGRRQAAAAGLADTLALVDLAPERALTDAAAVLSEAAVQLARRWSVAH